MLYQNLNSCSAVGWLVEVLLAGNSLHKQLLHLSSCWVSVCSLDPAIMHRHGGSCFNCHWAGTQLRSLGREAITEYLK